MIEHLLIHRATIVDVGRSQGTGGSWPESRTTRAADVPCRRAPASASELEIARNFGAMVTHSIWFMPDQEIERDDEVTIVINEIPTTYFVRVPGIIPSVPIYKKALVEERIASA